jgi:hypothetical protein
MHLWPYNVAENTEAYFGHSVKHAIILARFKKNGISKKILKKAPNIRFQWNPWNGSHADKATGEQI